MRPPCEPNRQLNCVNRGSLAAHFASCYDCFTKNNKKRMQVIVDIKSRISCFIACSFFQIDTAAEDRIRVGVP